MSNYDNTRNIYRYLLLLLHTSPDLHLHLLSPWGIPMFWKILAPEGRIHKLDQVVWLHMWVQTIYKLSSLYEECQSHSNQNLGMDSA